VPYLLVSFAYKRRIANSASLTNAACSTTYDACIAVGVSAKSTAKNCKRLKRAACDPRDRTCLKLPHTCMSEQIQHRHRAPALASRDEEHREGLQHLLIVHIVLVLYQGVRARGKGLEGNVVRPRVSHFTRLRIVQLRVTHARKHQEHSTRDACSYEAEQRSCGMHPCLIQRLRTFTLCITPALKTAHRRLTRTMARAGTSGLQKEVMALLRALLRAAKIKDPAHEHGLRKFIVAEFRAQATRALT
jgi:hypothetical protein